jgi:hypothetical protein
LLLTLFYRHNTSLQSPIWAAGNQSKYRNNCWQFDTISNCNSSLLDCFQPLHDECTARTLTEGQQYSTGFLKTEKLFACSINFLHEGKPRTWYVIPGERTKGTYKHSRLDKVVKETLHLDPKGEFMIHPDILKRHDIHFYTVVQNAGEFLITLPAAKYCHFSHGVKNLSFIYSFFCVVAHICLGNKRNIHESIRYFPVSWIIQMQSQLKKTKYFPVEKPVKGKTPCFVYNDFLARVLSRKANVIKRLVRYGIHFCPHFISDCIVSCKYSCY